jgi:inorganic pyrophosphatase
MRDKITVFIQNEAGSPIKNKHDEKTFEHLSSIKLLESYPYAYGFIPGTQAADGDCLDCYVITDSKLVADSIVECSPIGLLQLFENGQADHKVIATIPDETGIVLKNALRKLQEFIGRASTQFPNVEFAVGKFLSQQAALDHIEGSTVDPGNEQAWTKKGVEEDLSG